MKILKTLAISACMVAFANADSKVDNKADTKVDSSSSQELIKIGELGGFNGNATNFDGKVSVKMKFQSSDWHNFSGAEVSFEKGARTAWHSHPSGQILLVTKGAIYTGTRDGAVMVAKSGDVIKCPPNLEHWHGAGIESSGAHIALTFEKDGNNGIWKEKLSEQEYKEAIAKAKDKGRK